MKPKNFNQIYSVLIPMCFQFGSLIQGTLRQNSVNSLGIGNLPQNWDTLISTRTQHTPNVKLCKMGVCMYVCVCVRCSCNCNQSRHTKIESFSPVAVAAIFSLQFD